ncbi:DUF106 domain-containing protein [Candidatus Pacearchaeota archaeon]|nr:DUF106 domain-containing protein [Candidatus Pacearchaeota archaeon]
MKGMKIMFLVMLLSLAIAFMWNSIPIIKEAVHSVLDPTAGKLLDWSKLGGMILVVLVITAISTIFQKYGTDQEELKKLKQEQKILQEEMKKYKEHPEKLLELQKKQFEFIPKTMDLTMKPLVYTFIPFVLFFRWFSDYFSAFADYRFFGFLSWFWFYLIASIFLGSILRKVFKLA